MGHKPDIHHLKRFLNKPPHTYKDGTSEEDWEYIRIRSSPRNQKDREPKHGDQIVARYGLHKTNESEY